MLAEGTDPRDSGLIDRDGWIAYLQQNPGLSPDFAVRSAQVQDVPAEVARGSRAAFTVSGLDLTSLGSPLTTEVSASVGTGEPVSFAVTDGAAQIALDVPADAPAAVDVTLTTASGTTVTVPLRVTDAAPGGGSGADDGSGDGADEGGNAPGRPGALPVTGTDTAWMGAGVLAALALLGLGVALRRRRSSTGSAHGAD